MKMNLDKMCDHWFISRVRRYEESVISKIGTSGTHSYEMKGCYSCSGSNFECKGHFNMGIKGLREEYLKIKDKMSFTNNAVLSLGKELQKKVLIVDDDEISREILKGYFERAVSCDLKKNGLDGLMALACANDNNKPYDLMTLDIRMPMMGGLELLQKIREIEEKSNIPKQERLNVLIVSGAKKCDKIIGLSSLGPTGYLSKPFDIKELKGHCKIFDL